MYRDSIASKLNPDMQNVLETKVFRYRVPLFLEETETEDSRKINID